MIKFPDSNNRMLSDFQSTYRTRQHQDWFHPATIQIYDHGPNLSDRYSDVSSPNGGGSFTTVGQHNAQPTNPIQQKKTTSATNNVEDKQLKQQQNNKMEMSELGSQDITSSIGVSKSQGNKDSQRLGSQSNTYQKKKSKLNFLSNSIIQREQLILKTKKIIKKFLKSDEIVKLSKNGEQLRYIFKKITNFIKVVRVFTRSHSITADQHRLIRDLSSHRYDKKQFRKVKFISWENINTAFWKGLDWVISIGGLNKIAFQNKIVLLPTDQLNVYWMLFQFIFNFFALYYASIYIVFDFRNRLVDIDQGLQKASGIYTTNVYILIVTTVLDIIKGFNTAFYRKGETIIDRKEIAINYFKGRFIFDLLSLFSVIFSKTFFPGMDMILMYRVQFLFLFKIHNIQHIISVFKSTFIMKEKYDNIIQLFRLLCILCLTSHAMAICYHGEAQLQIYFLNSDQTWLHQAGIVDENYWVRYINSFFCSSGTLVNAIIYNPKTTIETLFMTICLLVNCCIFGYVINELGNIMDNIERNSKTSKKELRLINSFMQNKNVNRELQTRIRNYLEYMHREEKQLNLEETKGVIEKLSNQLKTELTKEVNTQYVANFHILNSIFSQKTQEKSLFIMQDHKYTPGEVIFLENDFDDCGIYLILEGSIDIYHTNHRDEDYLVKTLGSGQCFGEISFFTGQARTASARSSEFTSLIKIEREQFIYLLKEHSQEDYELFSQINHKIQQSQDYSLLYQKESKQGKCYTCGNTSHIAKNCNLTHFQPLPVAVVQTAQRSFYQDRQFKKRKGHSKWHPREHNNFLKMEAAIQRVEEEYESRIEELNENILDQSDYEIDQSDQPIQNNQDKNQMFDRQNTRDNHFMLLSNQEHNDTAGMIRGDYKNMSINIPNNPFYDQRKDNTIYINDTYKQDSRDLKENQRRVDSFNNIASGGREMQVPKEQYSRRGSKFALYQGNTLTQIQEIASPPVMLPGVSQGGPNPSAYYQQQYMNAPAITGLNTNNSFHNQGIHSPQLTSPKNMTIYGGSRKNKRQGTHLSGTQVVKRAMGKYDSQNQHDGMNLPRSNTNQGGHIQLQPVENQNNTTNKMKDSNINLVEQFNGTVSLHIDFMRNYKKYFPSWNISAIERTHIGKRNMQNSVDSVRKLEKSTVAKKSATLKRGMTNKKGNKAGPLQQIQNEMKKNMDQMVLIKQ